MWDFCKGLFPLKLMRIFTRNPTPVAPSKSHRDLDPPTGVGKETVMAESDKSKTVSVREKQIGDTLCIIESAISTEAKETAYNKIKRLILDHADRSEPPLRAA